VGQGSIGSDSTHTSTSTTPLGGIGFEGSMIPWATFTACRPTSTHPDCKRCASSSLVIPWLTGTRWICGMLVLHQVVELQGAWHLLPLIQVRNAVPRPCPPRALVVDRGGLVDTPGIPLAEGKWKRGRKGSKLFAVNGLELAVQYGVVERSVHRPVEIWEALGLEIEELGRFLTMDQSRWEAFWSGSTIGLWHEPPAGTVVAAQIKLVRKVWPEG